MILYKYVSLDTALMAIENSTVKFTRPFYLNDPFEVSATFYESENRPLSHINNHINQIMIQGGYGVLSLSRTPLNPLMWSHYAKGNKSALYLDAKTLQGNDAHAGVVIGFDVNVAGFNSEEHYLLPAKYGSVIYTSTKPIFSYDQSENHHLFQALSIQYDSKILSALQRVFLYKSQQWAYEEEVRVVRNLSLSTDHNGIIAIERASFKEFYIGLAHAHSNNLLNKFIAKVQDHYPESKVFLCEKDEKTWGLNARLLTP